MEIPKSLIEQIGGGNVVLFLGAGASMSAEHPKKQKMPTGQTLSNEIAKKFLGDTYLNKPLEYVAELALSENDLYTVQKFVADRFRDFKPSDFHKKIPTFKWKSIATTNYDLIVEDSYSFCKKPIQTLAKFISNNERVEDKITSPSSLPFYKLHGCINEINNTNLPLILTPEQYLTHKKNRSRLFDRVKELAYDYTFVFVGYSLADYDIRAMLLEIDKLNEAKPRSYMVGPYITNEESRLWDKKKNNLTKSFI